MEIKAFNLFKTSQAGPQNTGPSRPPNPVLTQIFNAARNAGIYANATIPLSEGDKAELENLQFSIRRLLKKVNFPQNRMRI